MSKTISATIWPKRAFELNTFFKVPHRCFNFAFVTSVRPLVFASNHASILSWATTSCPISLASYCKSKITLSRTASSNLYLWIYGPKTSMLFTLSFFIKGVPVKPIKVASGKINFIAWCSLPDCVRWHSSTNTKKSPFTKKSEGRDF